MVAIIVIVALVIFAAGVTAGTIVLVSWGVRQEERFYTLTGRAPGRLSQGARVLTGLYVRRRSGDERLPASRNPDIFA